MFFFNQSENIKDEPLFRIFLRENRDKIFRILIVNCDEIKNITTN
jgi:hypothetical protein